MASPRLGYGELTEGQDVPEVTVNEMTRYLEQGAGHFIIEDRDLATPPGSPAQGACYLVAASPTGAWSGNAGKLAFYMGTAWEFITVLEGFTAWIKDENLLLAYNGSAWAPASASPHTLGIFFTTTPSASEVLCLYTFAEAVDYADDFAGSVGDIGTNPTSSFELTVLKNGSSIGTITVSTGGVFTFVTTGGTVSFAVGDQIKITGPGTPDATAANCSITLKGTRA